MERATLVRLDKIQPVLVTDMSSMTYKIIRAPKLELYRSMTLKDTYLGNPALTRNFLFSKEDIRRLISEAETDQPRLHERVSLAAILPA